jgi:hypothetical protein
MKKIVLISSYCDTEEKILILKKNLKIYKELGLDTLLISPIKLQNDVIDDYPAAINAEALFEYLLYRIYENLN